MPHISCLKVEGSTLFIGKVYALPSQALVYRIIAMHPLFLAYHLTISILEIQYTINFLTLSCVRSLKHDMNKMQVLK